MLPTLKLGSRIYFTAAGGSLLTVAALLVYIQAAREGGIYIYIYIFFYVIRFFFPMYISPGLRGENRVTGGAILAAAALIVCIHAEREGVKFILVCFNIFFLPHVHFSRATGGEPGFRRLSTHGYGDFDSHTTSGTRGWGICFGVFQQCYSMFPGYGGGARLPAALYSRMRRF